MIKALSCVTVTLALSTSTRAALTVINFESDASGAVPNGFFSVDSPILSFSDSDGSDLLIGDFGIASIGQGLAVGTDDTSLLLMSFAELVDSLSLDFGNDDPFLTLAGDYVVLSAYLDDVKVGQSIVEMNRDGAMNQTISFDGAQFDSASLEYYVSGDGLTKVVDNIMFNTIPAPGAFALLAMFALRGRRARCTG